MRLEIEPTGAPCGAYVRGIDLSQPLSEEQVAELRQAWLDHHVLVFPEQKLSDENLERFTLNFGPFGEDPFFEAIPGHPHIAAIERRADETTPIFASGFHTDWSFMAVPPAGTCLYGIVIPPHGGDTLFSNQHLAYETLPAPLKAKAETLTAIHSAEIPYAPDGIYGTQDKDSGRSMTILASESARAKHAHPFIRAHTETGRKAIFSTFGYIQGFEGMAADESNALLQEFHAWQSSEQFIYRHRWEKDMLVMWDNRSLLHCATGGFDGYARLLHRTTIAERD